MKPSCLSKSAFIIALLVATQKISAQTFTSLWNEYVANPYNHPNIPNNSYAGYATGTSSLPSPGYTIYNVTSAPFNAIPNDAIDDQPAIQAAIDAAGAAGSGIVYLPQGTYYLHKPIYIKYNNVIVRGQGSTGATATILDFRFSMYSMFQADIDAGAVGAGGLWWATGLVWIGPPNSFKANGAPDMFTDYEHWRSTTTYANVTAVSNPGTFTITVDNTASLSVGMRVLLRYTMPSDRSLIKEIHSHAATKTGIDNNTYVGDCSNITSPGEQYYFWPAQIAGIAGNVVTFDRPLRVKVDPAVWPATLRNINGLITESGVENIQILGHNTSSESHLPAPTATATNGGTSRGGWNGLYINRSWNCWANNIRFVNLECGTIFSAAKNCTVKNTFVTSTGATRWYHHPFALRVFSSDNLVENFTIDGPSRVYHGINAEWYSSGNVYSIGLMKVGTFDSHRASAFDQIRTQITVANDAGSAPGGATTSGPFAGKRFAHWNITQQIQGGYTYQNGASRNGNDVYEPRQFPMGALVAITGTKDNSDGEYVPPGDLGAVEAAGTITDPALVNLYQAELNLRIGGILPIKLIGFVAEKNNTSVLSRWNVIEPDNGDRFILQWSTNGTNYTDINLQQANSQLNNYQYLHTAPDWNATNYYRLKIRPLNGSEIYSQIRTVRLNDQGAGIDLYPNPVKDKIIVDLRGALQDEILYFRIINNSGQVVKIIHCDTTQSTSRAELDLSELQAGQYYLEAAGKSRSIRTSFLKY